MNRILDYEALNKLVPLSRSTLRRMEKAGAFPPRIEFSKNRVGWLASEVEEWILDRESAIFQSMAKSPKE